MPGPLALVGSGEYTEAMLEVERSLIEGRPPKYVQIPTAAAPEGAQTLEYWIELGRTQADRLGVEAVPVVVTDRADADDPAFAAQVAGAGLIYLSGGNPGYLAQTLKDTLVWRAIDEAWRGGAALAGCSAGAMALTAWVPDIRRPTRPGQAGLALVPHFRVVPHFDTFQGLVPEALARRLLRAPKGVPILGIEEETALVGGPEHYVVRGRQSVWLIDGGRRRLGAGADVILRIPG